MTTKFTWTGISVTYDIFDNPTSIAPSTFEVVFPNDQAFFNYSVIDAPFGDLPEIDIGGPEPISATLNGNPLNDNFEDLFGFIQTPQGTHILLAFYDPATSTDHIFKVGGDLLTIPTTIAEFNALNASITGIGVAGAPFAPGQNILLSSLQNVTIEELPGDGNTIIGTDADDILIGTPDNDLIITGNATPFGDYVVGSSGNDTIDMSGNDGVNGFVQIDYFNQPSINVTINGVTNTGAVLKGGNGTDTLIGVANPLNAGNFEGGLAIIGTAGNDTFNVTLSSDQWMSIQGGDGQDSYVINGDGAVRMDFRSSPGGINVNLATGQIQNDGFGNFETISGTGNVWEVRGSLSNDTITGSAANESFRFVGGNNTINGGGGFDRLRYDDGAVASVNVDLAAGTANIAMLSGASFTDSLSNIEFVRGSNGNDTLRGDGGNNRLEGRGGDDVLISGGGNDTLIGGSGADRFVLTGTGNVIIADFQVGVDILDLRQVPLTAAAVTAAFANSTEVGNGTTVNLGAAGSLFLNGLTKAQALQITPLSPLPSTPVLMELFGGGDFLDLAFFNTDEDEVRLDVVSWTSTQIVLQNPSNGAVTTINGTGFPAGEQGNPPGTVTSWQTVDEGGNLVTRLTGLNWPLAEMFDAITAALEDGNDARLTALFNLQPLTANASGASAAVELLADGLTNSVFFTGSGFDDTLEGGDGNDTIRGEGGNDLIYGGLGNDDLAGGAGNDQIFGIAGANIIWGGLGDDTVQGGTGSDTIYGGGNGTNRLLGNDGDDLIFAGGGGDFIGGGAGNDTIRGGDGADTIYGGFGDDNMAGGAGNDQIFGAAGNNIIWGGLGNDTVQGGSGNDTIYGGGNGTNVLLGNDGDDVIYGGAGGDQIGGGAGNDQIFGLSGANIIWGGLGDDTVQGGTGNDTIYGGGDGTNQLFGNDGDDLIFAGTGGDFIGGGAGNDTIRGGAGDDTIYGGLGNDDLAGGAGNDVIFGSTGNNTIWGGLGNDTIHAGTGKDVINGGPGADTFVFASAAHIGIGAARDVISGFVSGEDQIDFTALGTTFNGTAGVLGGGQASFFYFAASGLLIGDQNGNGAADWVLELAGAPSVAAADFLL